MNGTEQESLSGDSTEQTRKEFQEKIERISKIVFDRRAVPFLGAGVSAPAVQEGSNQSYGSHLQNTACMRKRVCRYITNQLNSPNNNDVSRSLLEFIYIAAKEKSEKNTNGWSKKAAKEKLRKLRKRELENCLGLAEACEIALSLGASTKSDKGKKLVEEVLRIPKFSCLLPTRAHRYIAFLAREGLIDEVFTTNYDCCMERAYRQSFSGEPKEAVNQIHDGRTYRQQVGRRPSFRWRNKKYPRLTVYKLNGCAEAVKNGTADSSTILLTERQLQNWRERRWARDVFRDRLRSRSLIFSGFGSPEPQIRHTVIQILEEMSAGDFNARQRGEVRAPYVVCYDPQTEPTFHQWQIVNAFCQSDGNVDNRSVKDLLVMSPDGECFSADRFWEMIYRRVTLRLLQNLLAFRSEVADRIRVLLGGNGLILAEIASKLAECLEENVDIPHGDTDILRWLENHETTRLARWLYLMEGSGNPLEQKGIYLAIRDHRSLVGDFLLVWGAFIGEERKTRSSETNVFKEEPTIGVRIALDEQGRTLYLTGAGKCEEHPINPDEGNSAQKAVLLILGPMRPGIKPALVRPRRERDDEYIQGDLILVRLYLSEVLRSSEQPPQSLGELREFLERIALTPTVFFREEQPSLLSRLRRISEPGGTQ